MKGLILAKLETSKTNNEKYHIFVLSFSVYKLSSGTIVYTIEKLIAR